MAARRNRQTTITRLVRGGQVATQRELLEALRKQRLPADQSTLSRDLAELGIRKVGGRYVMAQTTPAQARQLDYSSVVRGFATCGPHLVVVWTQTGQAQPVAVAIDQGADPSIVGTLAGDDTIFVATRNRRTQAVALRRLEQWFGARHER